ncbi:unnamed protein product [Phytophthora fragariaefolia]|uniref:RxLR effector protein n=1 Tax=Phytophthora fragariaefolia TaxID=1490495 RepID=A0A9W6YLI1_9STRA|nr:unnamed protein product [Phytophthora fragariaefolia]GMF90255.1 unnamed protein product [Phytophthora fragariaefolia]
MRFSTVLLVIGAMLLGNSNALSTEVKTKQRLLRAHKVHHKIHHAKVTDEERGWFNSLPEQFQRMKNQPAYLEQTFKNWKSGMGSVDEAVAFMKSQELKSSDIEYFKKLYVKSLKAHRSH